MRNVCLEGVDGLLEAAEDGGLEDDLEAGLVVLLAQVAPVDAHAREVAQRHVGRWVVANVCLFWLL